MNEKYMIDVGMVDNFPLPCVNNVPPFAASGLPMRAGYTPLAANHGYGHGFCLHARPGITCAAPHIRNHMENPG